MQPDKVYNMKIELPSNFDMKQARKYILSLRLHPRGVSFTLHSVQEANDMFYHQIENTTNEDTLSHFKEFFFANEFLIQNFFRVNVINYSPQFTFVPSAIFEEKDKAEYFNFNFSESADTLLSQQIENNGISLIHNISSRWHEFVLRSFSEPKFVHHMASLMNYFHGREKMGHLHKLVINLNEDGMDVLCYARGKFVLGKHFVCAHSSDMLYYALFIWKQLKLDQLADMIWLGGIHPEKEILIAELQKYVQHVYPLFPPEENKDAAATTQNIPLELITLSLCEL